MIVKRDAGFYKRMIGKKLAKLEQHPRARKKDVEKVRKVLAEERPLEVLKSASRILDIMLKTLDLPPEAWPSPVSRPL